MQPTLLVLRLKFHLPMLILFKRFNFVTVEKPVMITAETDPTLDYIYPTINLRVHKECCMIGKVDAIVTLVGFVGGRHTAGGQTVRRLSNTAQV